MKKLIKIFGVAIFVYCCLGIFNVLQAQHNIASPDGPLYKMPSMIKKPVPVYCGPTDFMLKTAIEEFNQQPLVVGKVIVPRTGELIAMVTVFVSKDRQFDMSVLMTMFDKNETCLLAYGKELKFFKPKENKINEIEPKSGIYNGVYKINF